MSLVVYSSSSDDEADLPVAKKAKLQVLKKTLPAAPLALGPSKKEFDENESPLDCLDSHEGCIRNFPHVRGNWATYVYVPICCSALEEIRDYCLKSLRHIVNLRPTQNFHISLSRTVVLLHHHIDLFVHSLQTKLKDKVSLTIGFNELKVYINEEGTRTFVACKIGPHFEKPLIDLVQEIDTVMTEFKLPIFYGEKSFHVSLLWCLGNQLNKLNTHIEDISTHIQRMIKSDPFNLSIPTLRCRSGNKTFSFQLKKY